MSDVQQCNYVLRQGKSQGTRCVHKVSKKDAQEMYCSSHYIRFSSDSSSGDKPQPTPEPEKLSVIINLDCKENDSKEVKVKEIEGEILSEEIEKEFKERFAKEKKEMFYHKWRRHQFNNRLN